MAFPYSCEGALNQIKYHTQNAFTAADAGATDRSAAKTHWNLNQDHLAIEDMLKAQSHFAEAIKYVSFSFSNFYPYGALYYYLMNCIPEISEPEPITWKDIVEAWIKDDFEGRAVTVACIDRMRQLIWDEPFYVAWAARPEEQDI